MWAAGLITRHRLGWAESCAAGSQRKSGVSRLLHFFSALTQGCPDEIFMSSTPTIVNETSELQTLRNHKRKLSDETIRRHVEVMERLTKDNNGRIPQFRWLRDHGYFSSYQVMLDYPAAFAHLQRDFFKTFETYQNHNSAFVLPPGHFRKLSEYDVQGARFNPTELALDAGLSEHEFVAIGRALATVGQSSHWWIGDFISYGFSTYGKKVTYDLAQQATGYPRGRLYSCARVAKRFCPTRRVAALTIFHHQVICRLAPEQADELLAEAVEFGLTARQLLALSQERYGKKKSRYKRQKVSLSLWTETYDKLLDRAEGMPVRDFIVQIVEEYLLGKPVARYANGKKKREWREAVKA